MASMHARVIASSASSAETMCHALAEISEDGDGMRQLLKRTSPSLSSRSCILTQTTRAYHQMCAPAPGTLSTQLVARIRPATTRGDLTGRRAPFASLGGSNSPAAMVPFCSRIDLTTNAYCSPEGC